MIFVIPVIEKYKIFTGLCLITLYKVIYNKIIIRFNTNY